MRKFVRRFYVLLVTDREDVRKVVPQGSWSGALCHKQAQDRDKRQKFTKTLHFADKPAAAPVFTFRTQLTLRPQPHEPSGAFNIGY